MLVLPMLKISMTGVSMMENSKRRRTTTRKRRRRLPRPPPPHPRHLSRPLGLENEDKTRYRRPLERWVRRREGAVAAVVPAPTAGRREWEGRKRAAPQEREEPGNDDPRAAGGIADTVVTGAVEARTYCPPQLRPRKLRWSRSHRRKSDGKELRQRQ